MKLDSVLHYLSKKIAKLNKGLFSYPVQDQQRYMDHFPEPKDCIERAYFQYRCQMEVKKYKVLTAFINLASAPLIPYYLLKKCDKLQIKEEVNSVFFPDGKPINILPDELKKISGKIEIVQQKKEYLTKQDRIFFKKLVQRYPFSWHFLLKCLLKIRYYSYQIAAVKPQSIIVCNEYSYTCSAMTQYCRDQGIQHINIMHGEELYYMHIGFFCFDTCYVWDAYYKDLFCQLRAEKNQFQIVVPKSLLFDHNIHAEKEVDYTYYLGDESGALLRAKFDVMDALAKKGYRVAVRPHPRFSNMKEINKIQTLALIEDFQEIPIEKSVLRTRNAVSLYSTVLNQAYHNGVPFVIDDVTQPERYKKLKELKYIMLDKEHELLSQILDLA